MKSCLSWTVIHLYVIHLHLTTAQLVEHSKVGCIIASNETAVS